MDLGRFFMADLPAPQRMKQLNRALTPPGRLSFIGTMPQTRLDKAPVDLTRSQCPLVRGQVVGLVGKDVPWSVALRM